MLNIGVQLYIFKPEQFESETDRILSHVATCGYHGIEGLPVYYRDYSRACQRFHLNFYGPHIVAAELLHIEKVLDYCQVMQATQVISSGLIAWDQRGHQDYLKTAELLNKAANHLSRHGIQLHYHNHEFEFDHISGGKNGMELLWDHCDPDNVHFCLDLGWVAQAGQDSCAFLSAHADRVSYLHLRDFKEGQSVALGLGDLPVAEMWSLINTLPRIKTVIVEQDPHSTDPCADIGQSLRYLRSLK